MKLKEVEELQEFFKEIKGGNVSYDNMKFVINKYGDVLKKRRYLKQEVTSLDGKKVTTYYKALEGKEGNVLPIELEGYVVTHILWRGMRKDEAFIKKTASISPIDYTLDYDVISEKEFISAFNFCQETERLEFDRITIEKETGTEELLNEIIEEYNNIGYKDYETFYNKHIDDFENNSWYLYYETKDGEELCFATFGLCPDWHEMDGIGIRIAPNGDFSELNAWSALFFNNWLQMKLKGEVKIMKKEEFMEIFHETQEVYKKNFEKFIKHYGYRI